MSGAEALAVVGIVANIIQLIDFSGKVISRIKEYEGDGQRIPSSFQDVQARLPLISCALDEIHRQVLGGQISEENCKSLKVVLEHCKTRLAELRKIFDEVLCQGGASKGERIWKGMQSLRKEKKVEQILQELSRSTQSLILFHVVAAPTTRVIESQVNEVMASFLSANKFAESHMNRRVQLENAFWDRLGKPDFEKQLEFVAGNHEGTLRWILCDPLYNLWSSSNCGEAPVLWMPGPLGCGKSVAVKFLFKHLGYSVAPSTLVSFFCDDRDPTRRTQSALLRSVLYQILRKHNEILGVLSEDDLKADLSSPYQLWKLLEQPCHHLNRSTQPTYVLIDAVDELEDANRTAFLQQLKQLIQSLVSLKGSHAGSIRFLLTSRPWISVKDYLSSYPTLRFKPETVRADIEYMLADVVQSFARQEAIPDTKTRKIIDTIMEKAQGMFLWASIAWDNFTAIDSAWNSRTLDSQLEELESIPSGVVPLYEHILRRLRPEKFAWNVFKWLVYARRPLYMSELDIGLALLHDSPNNRSLALAFDISRSVQRLCGPFVRIEESENIINLVHQSARTFFQQSHQTIMLSAHEMIMNTCLTYLCFPDIPWGPVDYVAPTVSDVSTTEIVGKYRFIRYSISYWYYHYEKAKGLDSIATNTTMQLSHNVANKYEAERCLAFAGLPNFNHNTPHKGGGTALHMAAIWSWNQAIDALLAMQGVEVSSLDEEGCSPLHLSCQWALFRTAKQLIQYGGWKKAFHINRKGWHVLHLLVKQDLEDVACMILDAFDEFPTTVNSLDPEGNCLLHSMIRKGWKRGLEMMIPKPGINFEVLDRWGRSALLYAVVMPDTAISRRLVEAGSQVSHRDSNLKTALMYALEEGKTETIKLLLSYGANCDASDKGGRTTLHYAVSRDWVRVIKQLVERGADVNIADDSGILPIHLAAFHGNPSVVRWLMAQSNVQINRRSSNGDSIIFWAAKGRQHNTLQILLRNPEVDKCLKDRFGRTIMHVTVPWAKPNLVQEILMLDIVELNAKDHTGSTCLHRAAHEAADGTMRLVTVEYDSQALDIDQVDAKGRTALHYGAMNNFYAVKLLLWGNADQTLVDEDGLLPLDMAILWENIEAIVVLDRSLSDPKRLLSHM